MNPAAAIVIPTRNRIEELRHLVRSLHAQSVPLEILVMDDSESNAAGAMLAAEFPAVRYFRLASNRGPTFQRNHGIELASTEIAIPVDDDTVFVSARTVKQTLADIAPPNVGAVAIPYINVRRNSTVRQRAPDDRRIYLTNAFVGVAHAIKRSAFLEAGKYREQFFMDREESDLCIRLYDAGYVVRLGRADPIHHLESEMRDFARVDYLGSRNQVWFVWQNVPGIYLLPHLLVTTAKIVCHTFVPRRLWRRFKGIGEAYIAIVRGKAERKPVRGVVYRAFRFLGRHEASDDEVRTRFKGLLR